MRILVTGGAGFIGANFVAYWSAKYPNDEIAVLDKLTDSCNPQTVKDHTAELKNYTFIQGDICNPDVVFPLVKSADAVVHFAAESHVDKSITRPEIFIESNVKGTQILLEALRQSPETRFHHISTDEVFGALDLDEKQKFHEDYKYAPRSPYAASKAASDHVAFSYFHTYKLPITVSWCSNNFGPYQFPEKLIPLLITRLSNDLPCPIYGDGLYVREWLYVMDHCAAIEQILLKGKIGEGYCIGGAPEINVKTIAETICDLLDKPKELLIYTHDRQAHDRRYAMESDKMKNEFGWSVSSNFKENLDHTIAWYLQNTAWWNPIADEAHSIAEKYLSHVKN